MRKTFLVLLLTIAALIGLDIAVATGLGIARDSGRLTGLVRYFDYGTSVPGKLEQWRANPGMPGNLQNVAWPVDVLASSAQDFGGETDTDTPVVRAYGMSFSNQVLRAAQAADPTLRIDLHGGPAAPPNLAYALFDGDRANRRAGDIVVLAVLSSSVPAMAALSNRTWAFEQPAPLTYPVYRLENGALVAHAPVVTGPDPTPQEAIAFDAQLAREDAFYSSVTFGAPVLDASPLAKLIRRAAAKRHVDRVEASVRRGAVYPAIPVLQEMVTAFARTARTDGQLPVVMLIQGRDPADTDVLAATQTTLKAAGIPYLATARHVDIRNPNSFLADGHYRPAQNDILAAEFLRLVAGTR